MLRKEYINYDWLFKEIYEEKDLEVGNFAGFITVNVPHTNKVTPLNNFDEKINQITSVYKKLIKVDDLSHRYHLVFEGVGHFGKLYVNGKFVSEHKCGYTRWTSDITNYLHNGDNEIAVVVDAHEINQPPFGFVIDYLCFGGIYRDCYLLTMSDTYVTDYYFHYDENNWYLDYQTSNGVGNISITLLFEGKEIFSSSVKCGEKLMGKLPEVKLWNLDSPNLYDVVIKLSVDSEIKDVVEEKVGFRYCKYTDHGFYLNGKKVKIRGLNRHQSYPYVGYAMPERAQQEDAEELKNLLCVNAVRTSHYPQDPSFLRRCDEIGLLVFEEIPGWQNIGNDEWKAIAVNNVKDMIVRDRHHPCIILWGVRINESPDCHDFYEKTNKVAHEMDPYRPTGGVRCSRYSELLEDVYTYNDFICSGKVPTLRKKSEVTTSSKPYLVSEYSGHMHPTKSFDNEMRRSDTAKIHARVLAASEKDDQILGTFGWCFADYNTHRDFGSGDLICYHGVTDIFRNIKYSAYPYMIFSKKPFLEVTSNFNIGEHNGGYINEVVLFTNCERVEMYRGEEMINSFTTNEELDSRCIVIRDLIGNMMINHDGKTKEESDAIKEIVYQLLDLDGIPNDELIKKYGDATINEAWNYFGKYVSNWGGHPIPYTFKGYIGNELVIEKTKGPQVLDHIEVSSSTYELHTAKSYDVAKITIEAIGDLSNRVDYASDAFVLSTNSSLEIIGDNVVSLIGGARSFWVKTNCKHGEGIVTVSSPRFSTQEIHIKIGD